MDEIQQKIEEFKRSLAPQSPLKEILFTCPAVLPAVGLLIGLIVQFYFNLPLFASFGILTFCIVLFLAHKFSPGRSALIFISVFLCFTCLGSIRLISFNKPASNDIRNIPCEDFTFARIRTQIISAPKLVENNDWYFAEYFPSLPYTTFYAKVTGIKTTTGWANAAGTIKFYISEDANNLKLGDQIQTFCRLEKFSAADNPGQFDTKRYMNRNGVFLSASVKSANIITVLNTEKLKSPFNIKTKLRQYAIAALLKDAESDDYISLAEALVLGSRSKIDRKLYNDFIKTGLVHLVCLSGLHVGIFAGAAWWFSKKAGLLHTGRSIACIIATIIFLIVVPATSPTLRAGIMVIIFCLGRMFNRRSMAINSLAASAILLLLIRPMDFLSPGFQLSFAATIGILLFNEPIKQFLPLSKDPLQQNLLYSPLRLPLNIFSVGLAAWITVAPIIVWHFYQFQLLTAIWTIPASFPVTAIVILGPVKIILSALLPSLAYCLGFIINFSAMILSYLVTLFAKVPFSSVIIGKPSIYIVLLFYLPLFLWKFFPFRKRPVLNFIYPAAIVLLLISAVISDNFEKYNKLRLTVLSIGHGQAIYLKTPDNKNFIIDAGSITNKNIGDNTVNPFLNYIAADEIDSVFISHDDIDHYNGLPEILNKHKCKNVYTTPQFIQNAETSATDAKLSEFIRSGNIPIYAAPEKILLGKTVITRLWPKELPDENSLTDNESSLVSLVEYAGRKILFCSDITAGIQKHLMDLYPQLDVDLIITPHHGSARTLEPLFLSAFKPEFLITSCSRSRLSSTSSQIMEHSQSYYTGKDGAVTAVIDSAGRIKISTFK
ncbi:MAG: DNA internalization-related competence protein ComEC/Rec2 [Phycisphaerae bacterium]|jgi:competence protein ComEC